MQEPAKRFINTMIYDSQFSIGEVVSFDLKDAGKPVQAVITKVHFSDRKVFYDLEIQTRLHDTDPEFTRIHNVDSCFVKPA